MTIEIRRVRYFSATAADRPGSAYQVLSQLAKAGVNLLAFSIVPVGPSSVQLTLFPEKDDRLELVADSVDLCLMPPQQAFLVQGDDEIGVLADVHRRLADAHVNVYASSGVTDARGSFGYLLYVRPDDYERAATVLEC